MPIYALFDFSEEKESFVFSERNKIYETYPNDVRHMGSGWSHVEITQDTLNLTSCYTNKQLIEYSMKFIYIYIFKSKKEISFSNNKLDTSQHDVFIAALNGNQIQL